jgi:hypothetical protein
MVSLAAVNAGYNNDPVPVQSEKVDRSTVLVAEALACCCLSSNVNIAAASFSASLSVVSSPLSIRDCSHVHGQWALLSTV